MKFRTDQEILLIDFLVKKTGCSATKARKMIKHSAFLINGIPLDAHNPMLPAGTVVEIDKPQRIESDNITILHEDADLIAVDKPAGILSIKSIGDRDDTLYGKVRLFVKRKSRNREDVFIVHRLDQKVSGVILFAKSAYIQEALENHWQEYTKQYHALVEGCPRDEKGTIKSWLRENEAFKVFSGPETPDSKLAITHYQIVEKFKRYTLLNIQLGTGRKNQIRVHLADIGCPIAGDIKYGARTNPLGRIGLHACSMDLTHPRTGQKLQLKSPTPESFFTQD